MKCEERDVNTSIKTVISSIHCALSRLRIKWTRALHRAWQCDRVVVTKVKPIWIAQSLSSLSLSCNSSIQTIKSSSNLANRIIAPHLILAINSLSSSTPRHTLDSHRRFVDKRKSLQWTCAFYLLSDLLSRRCVLLSGPALCCCFNRNISISCFQEARLLMIQCLALFHSLLYNRSRDGVVCPLKRNCHP